jgi:hypothetical protein
MTPATKRPWPLYILLVLHLMLGLGAVGGGLVLMIRPDGSLLHMPVSALQGSPFHDFLLPGVILFLVLGVLPVFTFAILIARPQWAFLHAINIYPGRYPGWMFSLFVGIALLIWMDVELAVIGYGAAIQMLYSLWGLLLIIFTLTPSVMRYYGQPE